MADISFGGASTPAQHAPAARPPERAESERREAVDSDIERREAERSENDLQNKSDQAVVAQAKQEQRNEAPSTAGNHVDVLA